MAFCVSVVNKVCVYHRDTEEHRGGTEKRRAGTTLHSIRGPGDWLCDLNGRAAQSALWRYLADWRLYFARLSLCDAGGAVHCRRPGDRLRRRDYGAGCFRHHAA